jgi:transcriptional regulator GlxA family with amidase domain
MPGNWPLTRLLVGLLNSDSGDLPAGVTRTALPPGSNALILLDQIRHVLHHYRGDNNVRQPALQNRMAMVRQFEHQVRERINEVLPIPELCSTLGVNQRVLEYIFKQEFGMTPKQFCGVLRLNAFRQELLRKSKGNPTITEIAGRYGISHLGRLSAAYLRQFGELPSDTIRRQ